MGSIASLIVATLALAHQSPDIEKLWQQEQAARNAYNSVLYNETSKPDQIRTALADAEKVLKMTYQPDFDAALDFSGLRAFVYQRNDITLDIMLGYARLNDKPNFLRKFDELIRLLEDLPQNPKPPTTIYEVYYKGIKGRFLMRPMLNNPDVEKRLQLLASRSPDRRFLDLPYNTDDTDKVSESDRLIALSTIWSEAKYNFAYWDKLKTLDWDAAYRKAFEDARKAKDRYAFYNVVREFVGLLSDSHTDVGLPPSIRLKKEVNLPIRSLLVDGQVVVSEDSPLGLKKGDVVETIDGVDAKEYGEKQWGRFYKESTPHYRLVRIYTYMLWRGDKDSKASLGVRHSDGSRTTITAVRDGKVSMPPVPSSSFRILPDGTAYFAFNTCETDDVVTAFRKDLPKIVQAGRLVIDVRENGGGNSSVGWEILRHFITTEIPATNWETPQYRAAFRPWGRPQEPFKPDSPNMLRPHETHFSGKVAILQGHKSFSAAEDFLAVARTSGVARLFGEPSGGSTGQPHFFLLPGGGWVRMCAKRDKMTDGTEFVGIGIQPHERVSRSLAEWMSGKDPVLERAIAWTKS